MAAFLPQAPLGETCSMLVELQRETSSMAGLELDLRSQLSGHPCTIQVSHPRTRIHSCDPAAGQVGGTAGSMGPQGY